MFLKGLSTKAVFCRSIFHIWILIHVDQSSLPKYEISFCQTSYGSVKLQHSVALYTMCLSRTFMSSEQDSWARPPPKSMASWLKIQGATNKTYSAIATVGPFLGEKLGFLSHSRTLNQVYLPTIRFICSTKTPSPQISKHQEGDPWSTVDTVGEASLTSNQPKSKKTWSQKKSFLEKKRRHRFKKKKTCKSLVGKTNKEINKVQLKFQRAQSFFLTFLSQVPVIVCSKSSHWNKEHREKNPGCVVERWSNPNIQGFRRIFEIGARCSDVPLKMT